MKKLELQQRIRFSAICDFTGQEMENIGIVVGYGDAVRRKWPEEMAEADDSIYLVKVKMPEREIYFAVHISEVLETLDGSLKQQHPDECDCIECRARVEKGGLDYDPSNDDEEFEEHERQVFRDVGIDKGAK